MQWRCPHCATPQPEASRCWVCHRSSTSCGTCRHFRRSVAARVGYCGLDRARQPLDGDEVRACWQDASQPFERDPSMPGLLDLLTERALPVVSVSELEPDGTAAARPAPERRPVPRLRSTTISRDWVELEV